MKRLTFRDVVKCNSTKRCLNGFLKTTRLDVLKSKYIYCQIYLFIVYTLIPYAVRRHTSNGAAFFSFCLLVGFVDKYWIEVVCILVYSSLFCVSCSFSYRSRLHVVVIYKFTIVDLGQVIMNYKYIMVSPNIFYSDGFASSYLCLWSCDWFRFHDQGDFHVVVCLLMKFWIWARDVISKRVAQHV